jgi:hypothetical protein
MGRFNERLRRLENRFRDWGPSLEEVNAAFEQMAGYARIKLRGESVDQEQRVRDRDTVARWEKATGVDLGIEAEQARKKLEVVGHDSAPD